MAASPKSAFLYVRGAPEGPCKIGWSTNVERRGRDFRRKFGSEPELLHRAPIGNGYALCAERYAHWLLREHHFRNEWFNVSAAAAVSAVDAAVALDFRTIGLIPTLHDRYLGFRGEAGTAKRIDAVLEGKEKRADLIREAVEREIKRRERKQEK